MKPIEVDLWLRNIAFITALIFGGLYVWAQHDIRTLVDTNAELARYVTVRLDSLEVAQARLDALQQAYREALRTSGPVAADSVMRSAVK